MRSTQVRCRAVACPKPGDAFAVPSEIGTRRQSRLIMSTDAFLQRFEARDPEDADRWFDFEAIAALRAEAERK